MSCRLAMYSGARWLTISVVEGSPAACGWQGGDKRRPDDLYRNILYIFKILDITACVLAGGPRMVVSILWAGSPVSTHFCPQQSGLFICMSVMFYFFSGDVLIEAECCGDFVVVLVSPPVFSSCKTKII